MAGLEFINDIPFRDVYIHGTVRDIKGKKMSKSLGNVIDPLEIIAEYGTDALRFSLISITAQGQDVFLSKDRFQQGRNFANKIWNASRFVLMNLDEKHIQTDLCTFFQKADLDIVNRWILSRFYSVLKVVEKNLEVYKFNEAANSLYSFFWHEFCDWYLELVKPALLNRENDSEFRNTQIVMYKVLEKFLRCLHPFMPFVTEEIWQLLNQDTGHKTQDTSIMLGPWPHIQEQLIDKKIERQAQILFDVITQIRNLRSLIEIKPDTMTRVCIYAHGKAKEKLIKENVGLITNLAKLENLRLLGSTKKPKDTLSTFVEGLDIFLEFGGLINREKEKQRIEKELQNAADRKAAKEKLLKNAEFIKKAPRELVDKTRQEKTDLQDKIERLEKLLKELG
jgi:valyl-tRNA synthetase